MYQKVCIIGNLGRDPEMRFTPTGAAVANFSVCATEKYNNAEGTKVDRKAWFNISVWGRQAEAVTQYLKKGSKVYVEGSLNPGEDGNPRQFPRSDGTTGSSYEVRASTVKFLSTREGGEHVEELVSEQGVEPF